VSRPFSAYAALAANLLDQRRAIAERIENRVVNVKGKPLARQRDGGTLAGVIDACVFAAPGVAADATAVRDDLLSAHLADGFEALFARSYVPPLDPAALLTRAYEHWDARRWPGTNARLAFAQSLFACIILRLLQTMALRIWDGSGADAAARLATIQQLLDRLNSAATDGVLVRDARWLVQTGQGAITKHLAPYFDVAVRIADSLPGIDGEVVHAAGALLAGGHLRSQLRHRAAESGLHPQHPDVLATTRNSNSLDVALLVWDLVPLLESYVAAVSAADTASRAGLASVIVQAWSADPELLLARFDLLTPCTMIETLFVERDASGRHRYSETGDRHLRLLERYAQLVDESAASILADLPAMAPASAGYSPFGLTYGFAADLLARIALDRVYGGAAGVSLEDFFAGGPRPLDVRHGIEYSRAWADDVFRRTGEALALRAAGQGRANASAVRSAALVLAAAAPLQASRSAQEQYVTSDVGFAMTTGASALPRSQFMADRNEARFLGSAEIDSRWFGISKVVLTLRLAQGEDAIVWGVPDAVRDTLALTCPGIVTWRDEE